MHSSTILYNVGVIAPIVPMISIAEQLAMEMESKATKYFDDNQWYDAMEYESYRLTNQPQIKEIF